jgi:GNAT superfamily N-acetyltransferase
MARQFAAAMVVVERVEGQSSAGELYGLLRAYEDELPADLRHGSVPEREEVARMYGSPNAAYLARRGTKAIGCIGMVRLDAQSALVQRLYVDPAYRGLGAARALVETVIASCRAQQYGRIVLDTDRERLSAAYRLYASLGFRLCAPYGEVEYATPTFMELPLGPERAEDAPASR